MRHVNFRFIVAVIWLLAAIVSLCMANVVFAMMYVAVSVSFFVSAHRGREKDR